MPTRAERFQKNKESKIPDVVTEKMYGAFMTQPKKQYSMETLLAANQAIRASRYVNNPARWHWVLFNAAREGHDIDPADPAFYEGVKIANSLSDAVWEQFYATTFKLVPYRGLKRRVPSGYEDPLATLEPYSLVDMANNGTHFKLDWNNDDSNVHITILGHRSDEDQAAILEAAEQKQTCTTPIPVVKNCSSPVTTFKIHTDDKPTFHTQDDFDPYGEENKENIRPFKIPILRRFHPRRLFGGLKPLSRVSDCVPLVL
ncbi:hypothetical protein TWF694_007617 [Orbilia ellipsospora]|uniref:Uncharacterized protein n=1 Tax=Orbilia ellipsospora TaxID=2528407 RepID=A0AAV9XIC5_9PEZI